MAQAPSDARRHPAGLYICFFTEMWERFGYYLMVGILFLYLRDTVSHGGRGLDNRLATDIVGSYVALVFLTPFIGGLVADRYWGYRRSVIVGGVLMASGYFLLAYGGSNVLMFSALGLIILGNGFFKANISTMVGNLYNTDALKPKKDAAYNIFYMGINIGAFSCNFVAAYLRNHYGWGHAFAAAGFGMVLGVVIFVSGIGTLRTADVRSPVRPGDVGLTQVLLSVFAPALAVGAVGWFLPGNFLGSDSNDAFVFACVPIVYFYVRLWWKSNPVEKRRVGTLLVMFAASLLFWNIYNQNATALTIWAETYTNRNMPSAIEPALRRFDLAQTVNRTPKEVPVLDDRFHTELGTDGKVVTHQSLDPYFKNLPRDQWPAEGQDLKLISTELFQSINPFWIIFLTPIFVGFFGWLRSRGKEPSTPTKMALGIVVCGISSLVMVAAALSGNIYAHKVSPGWLFASYGVFTLSELSLSPIGLSLVSKVAPRRITGLMMGGFFLTISLGGKISAILTSFWDKFDSKALFFGISAAAAILAGLALLPLTRRLAAVVEEANASNE